MESFQQMSIIFFDVYEINPSLDTLIAYAVFSPVFEDHFQSWYLYRLYRWNLHLSMIKKIDDLDSPENSTEASFYCGCMLQYQPLILLQ